MWWWPLIVFGFVTTFLAGFDAGIEYSYRREIGKRKAKRVVNE